MKTLRSFAAAAAISMAALPGAQAASVSGYDVVFTLDSSGSVGEDNFNLLKTFVNDIVENQLDPSNRDNRVGVVRFADQSTVETFYRFSDPQQTTAITTAISAIPYTAGLTATRVAIDESVDIWTEDPSEPADPPRDRLIFLITDGVPVSSTSQNPCLVNGGSSQQRRRAAETRQSLEDQDITVNIIGIGNDWNPDILSCLVDDPETQITRVEDFDALAVLGVELPPTTIPVPAGLPLLAGGLVALGLARRRADAHTARHTD